MERESITMGRFLECADEYVELSGNLHALERHTINGRRAMYSYHYQPMGLQGYGAITGNMYNATGVTRQTTTIQLTDDYQSFTFVNRYHFVGTAGAASFWVKHTKHVTVNGRGEVTSQVDNYDYMCE